MANPEFSISPEKPPAKPVTDQHIVVLIHGIRTQGSWAEMVAGVLRQEAGVKVVAIRYGFFDVFRFLCPFFTRNEPVRRIIRELRDLRAMFPTARISVIAHSFGTYAMMKALGEPDISLHRAILCGCIVKEDFRRAPFRAQLGADDLLNDCGTHDIWPVLAKSVTWGYGATGTFGFGTTGVHDRFSKFSHGDYFDESFVRDYWVPFIRDGEIRGTEWERHRTTPPYWMSLLAWLPLRWLPLLAAPLIALLALWPRGTAQLTLGPQALIAHYTGTPEVVTGLYFVNDASWQATFTGFSMTAISPEGKRLPLATANIVLNGSPVPPLFSVNVTNREPQYYDYSFFQFGAEFSALQQQIGDFHVPRMSAISYADPDREIIPAELVEKARSQMQRLFPWTPGVWKLELAYMIDGKPRTTTRTFDLTEDQVEKMKHIADLYPTGIGLLQPWKYMPARDAVPTVVVQLRD